MNTLETMRSIVKEDREQGTLGRGHIVHAAEFALSFVKQVSHSIVAIERLSS